MSMMECLILCGVYVIVVLCVCYVVGDLMLFVFVDVIVVYFDVGDLYYVWIWLFMCDEMMLYVDVLVGCDIVLLLLYGVLFVIKDNIDFVGILMMVGCFVYVYMLVCSVFVVEWLIVVGVILVGKMNFD